MNLFVFKSLYISLIFMQHNHNKIESERNVWEKY